MENKLVLIVDGYSNGRFFAPKLKARGYSCIHLQSRTKIPEALMSTFRGEDYLEQFIYLGNIKETLSQLKKYDILYVIPGHETGVELADQLSETMGLLSNGTQLSAARRDKFVMVETLKKAGLKTVQHIQSDKVEEILDWARKLNKWPVVVKPLKSFGNDQVCFCHSENEIKIAFNSIINTETVIFDKNEAVLAQSYLHDEQYEINAVGFAGKYYISDVWLCKRLIVHNTTVAYDYIKLLPFSECSTELINYIFKILDALEIKYGASHCQVMLEVDGPVIIECAARVMGTIDQDYIARATGKSQVDLTIDSYIDSQYFLQEITKPYEFKNHLMIKFIFSSDEGKIKSIKSIDKIKQLKSFYNLNLSVKVGDQLKRTIDLYSCPGLVYLLHKNEEVILEDYNKLVAIEKQMFEVQ
ncbi:MAG: hypothetical protein AMJ43_02575 [Coxiella sp. DG_40]|nr:MAG: hypothetical protein AMJ43_02575 [Coxiella sp. DG_40]